MTTEPLYVPIAIEKARRIAQETGRTMAVVELDAAYDSRIIRVVDNDYTYTAEYEAFAGVLIAEVYPPDDAGPGYPGPCPEGMDYTRWLAMNNVD